MNEPSRWPSPGRRLGKARFSRQQQVRWAVREARAALRETLGMSTPPSQVVWQWARRRARHVTGVIARGRRRSGQVRQWRFPIQRHLTTVLVLLLLGLAIVGRGVSAYTAPQISSSGGEGGILLLGRAQESSELDQAFASSAVPMAVVRRNAPQEGTLIDLTPEMESAVRTEVVNYTVQTGDTLDSIAEQFGIAAYTVFWQNGLHSPSELSVGMQLELPPISGVPHVVQPGETLESIADWYGVRAGNIVGYPANELHHPYELIPGQEIFVPGAIIEIPDHTVQDGERPAPTLVQMPGGEKMRWPTWGTITTNFGWSRWHRAFHYGIDIANRWRTPIYAAAGGTVAESGWGGLGWYVVIDHGNGFRSEYGHLNERPLVAAGEQVAKGQQIGYMGRTYGSGGYASGVHLHFAVRHLGVYIDPLPLLEN